MEDADEPDDDAELADPFRFGVAFGVLAGLAIAIVALTVVVIALALQDDGPREAQSRPPAAVAPVVA